MDKNTIFASDSLAIVDSIWRPNVPSDANGWLTLADPLGLPDDDIVEDDEWPDLGPILDLMMI
ncbi:MAG: hypothetical protein FJ033_13015 [Chloroflexi bacterium]|nr:hypothetical protein [Chloroflexota bacterium]